MTDHAPDPAGKTADASDGNWVDEHAPPWAQGYLRLMRADRPIGTWLLMWPCWWSLSLAGTSFVPDPLLLVLFAVGAFVMRGAGCTYNDIVDRDFDAAVERTASRPLPSGQVGLRSAVIFMGALLLIGLGILLLLNDLAILLGVGSLALIGSYPFMKRITYWPQAWLGLTFNWGALLAWAAVTGSLGVAPLMLYVAGIFWTLGYDTIYAHQDKDDDALIGVKSTALAFGDATASWLKLFYGLFIAGLMLTGYWAGVGSYYYVGVAVAALHCMRQVSRVDIDDPGKCLSVFKSNHQLGMIVFAATLLGHI